MKFLLNRAYNPDGTLVARSLPGSMIHDKNIAISRVIRMVKQREKSQQ